MRMQEPEQWPSSEAPGTTGQEYGTYTYRAEMGQNAFEQKILPQESRVSVLNVLIIVFSFLGFCPAIFSAIVLYVAIYNNLPNGIWSLKYIFVLLGPIVTLLLFVTIFVLAVITVVRRAARSRRSRFR